MRVFLCFLSSLLLWSGASARELEVHFIDVGQGDAILIRSPAGKTVLIDAGNIGADEAVNDYLDRLGVGELDLAITSHPHLDHMGGMLEVLKRHRPKQYLDPAFPHPLENYDALLDWLETQQIPVRTGRAGRRITLEEGIVLELFAPDEPLLSGTRSDANSNSIVARLSHGTQSFLFTGDSEDDTERRLLKAGVELQSTVLKVAHHGGRHSTSDFWLARVKPSFAVISCGALNRYGHPAPETLRRLDAREVQVFRTDTQGDIVARSDGQSIRWETTGDRSARIDEPGGTRSFSRTRQKRPAAPAPALAAAPSNKAPRPVAKPGAAYRSTGREAKPTFENDETLSSHTGRLFSASRRVRPNVNLAGAEALAKAADLPLAAAELVVADREKNGPFHSPAELARISGLSEKDRQAISASCAVRIELNTATAFDLVALGLAESAARAVVEHRSTHGEFSSIDDLEYIDALSHEARTRLAPLLTVGRASGWN